MAAPIAGKPLIDWVMTRMGMVPGRGPLVLLTSGSPENDFLEERASALGFPVHRGHETDVASRFTSAALAWPASHYVRVCADNPFVCFAEVARLVEFHVTGCFDYSFNHIPALGNGYADGFGAEIFSSDLMQLLATADLSADEKEHVTRYFWNRHPAFKFGIPQAPAALAHPDCSFDIDTPSDLARFQRIEGQIGFDWTGSAILGYLLEHQQLEAFKTGS